ncbi:MULTISPECIES: YgaP family membrane protein [Neobacillus]|uniref:DUF2892 domain-containing protein n=1 Tax=Neobacillus rhizophilus TaxID=2833579 RepID=A0A942U805_9BACI|nr:MULTISPECIES: DUF2892 domain-containing protein [Neobacillus]MBS4216381.1 DUF2892 domain-containing protein [Neobacillus rhizophilus]MBU8917063.1 DUF2892 domain-containing protein [Bacillus sp. FJAT-29953]
MKITPNIGILNALIRITVGLTLLSWCTAKLVKQPWRDSYLFVALCGAMKVAEGIVRYCPMTALFEKCQCMVDEGKLGGSVDGNIDAADGVEGLTGDAMPYNPT